MKFFDEHIVSTLFYVEVNVWIFVNYDIVVSFGDFLYDLLSIEDHIYLSVWIVIAGNRIKIRGHENFLPS